jgi:hypothetical protein
MLKLTKDIKQLRGKVVRDVCFAGDTFAIITTDDLVYACTFSSHCIECNRPLKNFMRVRDFMVDMEMDALEVAVNKRVPKFELINDDGSIATIATEQTERIDDGTRKDT